MKNLLIGCIVSIIIVPFCAYAATDTVQLKELAKEAAKYEAVTKDLGEKIDELKAIIEDIGIMATQLETSGDTDSFVLNRIYTSLPDIFLIYNYEHELLCYIPMTIPKLRSTYYSHRIKMISASKLRLTFHLQFLNKISTGISNKSGLLAIEKAKNNIRSTLKILDQITKLLEEGKTKQNP